MADPKSINDRLIQKADEKLEKEVSAATAPLASLLNNGGPYMMEVIADGGEKIRLAWPEALAAMRKHAIAGLQKRRRQQEIDGFMRQVERLASEVEELRAVASD